MESPEKIILAFVGMPGAGKSEAVAHLKNKKIPFVRFGEITDEGVRESGLELNPQNERIVREQLRKKHGMSAYALKAKPKIDSLFENSRVVAIDGLYSWEEYTYLKKEFPGLVLIHIYAEPQKRYERLTKRPIRPVSLEESRKRDVLEIENLNKGGPIAIADYLIENSDDDLQTLFARIDHLLERLHIV